MFYLFHGKDAYSRQEFLSGLLAKQGDPEMLSLNTTRLGGKVTFAELQGACDAMPFLSRVRVVIIENLFASSPDKAFLDKLEDYLPNLPETTRLFFLEGDNLPDSHRIVKLAGKAKAGHV